MAENVPLSGADSAWLRMEGPANPMVVAALIECAGPLDVDCLRERIRSRLLAFAPFRSRLEEHPLGAGSWTEAEAIDLGWHVCEERLAPAGDEAALRARVGELLAAPLERDRPLWRCHLLRGAPRGTAMVWRIHHAYGDGTALLHVLLSLTDGPDEPLPLHRLPRHPHERARLLRAAGALGHLLLLPRDAATSLRAPLAGRRGAAWSRPLQLDALKTTAHGHGTRLNDLLVAAMAGALRHLLRERGEPVDGRSCRAIVPVDLRPPEELGQLGNRFGLVFLELPLGVAGPARRLAEVKARMDRRKRTLEAVVALRLLQVLGAATPALEAPAVRHFASRASLVLTNVAGPVARRSIAGAPIESMLFWVPAAGGIGIGASFFSYAGALRLALGADAACVPAPEALVRDFERELERLGLRSG